MKQRILSMILALGMLLAVLPLSAGAISTGSLSSAYQQALEDFDGDQSRCKLTSSELSNMAQVYTYLTEEMGLNTAAACGVMGNMLWESNFNPSLVANNRYIGLVQWDSLYISTKTGYDVKGWIIGHGYDSQSLEGQLEYLYFHLAASGDYKCSDTYEMLKGVPNTAEGAYTAGYRFCYDYERPSNKDTEAEVRGTVAQEILYVVFSQLNKVETSEGTGPDTSVGTIFTVVEEEPEETEVPEETAQPDQDTDKDTDSDDEKTDENTDKDTDKNKDDDEEEEGTGSTVSSTPGPVQLPFSDVSSDKWYYAYVARAYQQGYFSGTSSTTFSPDKAITRAQIVQVLYSVYLKEGNAAVTSSSSFDDVDDDAWYAAAVAWGQKKGIISGMGDNQFAPDSALTREQFALILMNYNKAMGNLSNSVSADLSDYSDYKELTWSEEAMKWAVGSGLISGTSQDDDVVLDPKGTCTRAQGATIITNYFQENE